MTKFLIHGGATGLPVDSNKQFFKQAIPDLDRTIKVLIVYFSRKKEDYDWMFEQDIKNFKSNSPDKKLELEIAEDDKNKFIEQIKKSDVIYVRGGDTIKLLDKIKQISSFGELLKDKVYAGSSAGMYLVAKYFYNNDGKRIREGLGVLPIKAFAHWDETKQDIVDQLDAYKEKLPIYKVREGEFVVIEQ